MALQKRRKPNKKAKGLGRLSEKEFTKLRGVLRRMRAPKIGPLGTVTKPSVFKSPKKGLGRIPRTARKRK